MWWWILGERRALLEGLQRHLQVVAALLLGQLGELHQARVLPLVIIPYLKQQETHITTESDSDSVSFPST